MEQSTKARAKSPMYEACAPNRMDDIQRASDLMQALWPRGALCRRIKAAADELTAKPYRWSYNRVLEVFKGRAARIDNFEMEHLRAIEKAREVRKADDGIRELRARLSRLETALAMVDAEFHGQDIDGLRQSLRGLGGLSNGSRAGGRE